MSTQSPKNENNTEKDNKRKGAGDEEKTDIFDKNNLPEDMWMLRVCNDYLAEYNNCTSWKGRLSQIYITGEEDDCSKWNELYKNCQTFRQTKSLKALNKVLEQEKERYLRRIKNSMDNDVWEKRTCPPEDWNQPVAEGWMESKKDTLLDAAQRGDDTLEKFLRRPRCVIL